MVEEADKRAPVEVATDILLAVARKIPRPRLAVFPAGKTSLRLAQKQKVPFQRDTFVFCAPTWARTRDRLLKRELLYQLSYRRFMKTLHDSVRAFNTRQGNRGRALCRG